MRIAILCDGAGLARWQHEAIAALGDRHELLLLVVSGGPPPRRRWRHAAYYALNLASIRNRQTRRVAFPPPGCAWPRLDVTAGADGQWATLPDAALAWLAANRVDAVVKFALDLLRIPDDLNIAILSFHHGDPSRYRGRPAGFHELADGARYVGQVVQILSNRLDSGAVLAFAQSVAVAHSYRKTLVAAFRLSPPLLGVALRALEDGTRIDRPPVGPNYRLPTTGQVVAFVAQRLAAAARHLAYGLLIEKRWRVASVPGDAAGPTAALAQAERDRERWAIPRLAPAHRFHADPFFAADGSLLVEALDRRGGRGAIVRIAGEAQDVLAGGARHFSYPATIGPFVVPETIEHARPAAYRVGPHALEPAFDLDIDEPALLDPTPLAHGDHVYLFGNRPDEPGVLRLWVAPSLDGRFTPHPASPVRVSARGSRMAGPVADWDGRLVRLGQDWRTGYGDGIIAFTIETLTPDSYAEREDGAFAFTALRGPHTVAMRDGVLLFDFYTERASLLAGWRRVRARIGGQGQGPRPLPLPSARPLL